MGDWRSYDDVADAYERVHAPRFLEPGRDLLDLAGVLAGEVVLDVGAGTGAVTALARERGASAVGADASHGMLRVARRARPQVPVVAAEAIDLPFRDATFDVVLGGFVLAHFTKVETALFRLIRATKPGGRLAFSSWADGPDLFTETWLELVTSVVPKPMLEPTMAGAIPGHDRFRKRDIVQQTLWDAGLRKVKTEVKTYTWTYRLDEYLEGLEVMATGRFTHEMLGEERWVSFQERARATFAERFPDPIQDTRRVLLSVGTNA